MTVVVSHAKPEHRDAHIASGMEGGMQVSMNRLEDLVIELDRGSSCRRLQVPGPSS